jgi:hypothetical protein
MIPKPLKDVLLEDILSLVLNEATEARTLDFKLELPGHNDKDRREFCADVAAFANSGGGDIVYGVEDIEGKAVAAPGLESINVDQEIRRLQQMSLHVEPRIRVHGQAIAGNEQHGPFIALRIEDSTAAPHAFRISDGTYRFFARADRNKYPMSLDQIKAAFIKSGSIRDQIEGFRAERWKSRDYSIPLSLQHGPWLMAQIIPFSAFSQGRVLPMAELGKTDEGLAPLGYSVERSNADGFLRYHKNNQGWAVRYCQAFRNGCLEFVEGEISATDEKARLIGGAIDVAAVRAVGRGFKFLRRMGVEPPLVIYLALANVQGYEINVGQRFDLYRDARTIDRQVVEAPEIFADDLESDIPRLIKPAIDVLWEASGIQGSNSYDAAGTWIRQVWI